MKRRKRIKACRYHILGHYYSKEIGVHHFATQEELKDRDKRFAIQYYNFCPICGTEITDEIKEYQLGGEE